VNLAHPAELAYRLPVNQ
jgi:hypothetical protein